MQQGFTRVVSIVLTAGSLAAPLWIGSAARAQEPAPAPAGPTRAQLLEEGEQLISQQQYRRAVATFEDANRLADAAGCPECFLGMSRAYVAWGRAAKGVEMARVALQLNPPAKPLQARSHHQLAVALLAQPGRGADAMAEADAELRKALELDPGANVDRFNLAALLFQAGRAEDSVALARDYLKGAPTGGAATEARMLICLARKGAPADQPAEAGAEMEPPHPLYRQPPVYSDRARRDKLQGSVLVQVNIDSDGCAGNATLVRGMGNELDTAAVEAAKRWVFQPATVQGKAVPADSIVSINFTKDNETIKEPEKVYRDKLLAGWPAQ